MKNLKMHPFSVSYLYDQFSHDRPNLLRRVRVRRALFASIPFDIPRHRMTRSISTSALRNPSSRSSHPIRVNPTSNFQRPLPPPVSTAHFHFLDTLLAIPPHPIIHRALRPPARPLWDGLLGQNLHAKPKLTLS